VHARVSGRVDNLVSVIAHDASAALTRAAFPSYSTEAAPYCLPATAAEFCGWAVFRGTVLCPQCVATSADDLRTAAAGKLGTASHAIHQSFWAQPVAVEDLLIALKVDRVGQLT
jgi:hypothetical protein